MTDQNYPPGWDEQRVRQVLAHYESQTEDEEIADLEAAASGAGDGTPQGTLTELADQLFRTMDEDETGEAAT